VGRSIGKIVKQDLGTSGGVASKTVEWAGLVLLCLVVGSVVSWHFFTWHGNHMEELHRYQRDLLDGHPSWVATQNRILGPYLIDWLMHVRGKDYAFSYNYFMHVSFILISFSVVALCKAYRLDNIATVFIVLSASGIELLMFNYWWFPWSNLEFSLLCLTFVSLTIEVRAIRIAVVGSLFAIMCLNKETAVFFPFWLIMSELARYYFTRSEQPSAVVKRISVYILMILTSLTLTSYIRRELWVSSYKPERRSGVLDDAPQFLGNNIEILGGAAWERGIDTIKGLYAMLTLQNPVPLFGNKYWGDWSQPQIFFYACFVVSFFASVKTFLNKDAENFAIAFTCFAYALVIAVLSNPVEVDKMMGFFAFGLLFFVKRVQNQGFSSPTGATT